MAFQNINCGFIPHIPMGLGNLTDAGGFAQQLLDASGEKCAFIFQVGKAGTLDTVGIRFGAVTTAQDMKVSFQTVNPANGDPDGTIDEFRVIPSASVVANTWVETGLMTDDGTDGGAKRTVTEGDLIAVVVEFDSTVGDLQLSATNTRVSRAMYEALTYVDLFTASWVKQNALPNCALKYNDGSYGFILTVWPAASWEIPGYNTTSSPDERSLRFKLPVPIRVGGAWFGWRADAPMDIILYDSNGTDVLKSVSIDPDFSPTSGLTHAGVVRFNGSVDLLKDTFYRLAQKPTTTTSIRQPVILVDSVAIFNQMEGGPDFHMSTREDAGAWTQDTVRRPLMGLMITGLDDGAGGGGLLVHPSMSGGMRG